MDDRLQAGHRRGVAAGEIVPLAGVPREIVQLDALEPAKVAAAAA